MSGVPSDAFRNLLQSEKYSDFIISTNGVEFKVHKAIIASGSDFFRAVCDGGFKENVDGRVDLPDDLPDTIARVVYYLYTGSYMSYLADDIRALLSGKHASPPPLQARTLPQLAVNILKRLKVDVRVYLCADKLDIRALVEVAAWNFRRGLETFCDLYAQFYKTGLAELAALIFESTADDDLDLRQYFIKYCIDHYETTEQDTELLVVIKKHELIAWTLLRAFKCEESYSGIRYEEVLEEKATLSKQLEDVTQERDANLARLKHTQDDCAELANRMRKILISAGNTPASEEGAEVNFCPHCGAKGYVGVKLDKEWYNNHIERVVTECAECGKKLTFTFK